MAITYRDMAQPDFRAANSLMANASSTIAQVTDTFGRMNREHQARQKMQQEAAQQAKANQVFAAIGRAKNAEEVQKAYGDLSGTGAFGGQVVQTGIAKADSIRDYNLEGKKVTEVGRHNKAAEGIDANRNAITKQNNVNDNKTRKFGYEQNYKSSKYGADKRYESTKYSSDQSLAAANVRANATMNAAATRAKAQKAAANIKARGSKNGDGKSLGQLEYEANITMAEFEKKYPNAKPMTLEQALRSRNVSGKDAAALAKLMNEGKPKPQRYNDKEVISDMRNYMGDTLDKKDQLTVEKNVRTFVRQAYNGELYYTAPDGSVRKATPAQALQASRATIADTDGRNAYTKFSNVDSATFQGRLSKALSNLESVDKSSTAPAKTNRRGRPVKRDKKTTETIQRLKGQQ